MTESRNVASRFIIQTLSKGDFKGNIIFTGFGIEAWMAQQSLVLFTHLAKGPLPDGLYQAFNQMKFGLVLDQMLLLHCQLDSRMAINVTSRPFTPFALECTPR